MTRLLVFSLGLLSLCSFTFGPMSQSLDLNSNPKQVQYLVDNPTDEPMAVEISLKDRLQREDGTEDTPVTKDLAAFPPQLIVPPKEKRSIRVSWLGQRPAGEKSYRVVAEQLPLDVDGKKRKGSGIKMLLKYVAALYVDPGDTSAKLELRVVERKGDKLVLTVENKGSAHAPLTKPTLVLSREQQKIVLKTEQLKGLAGENVLAGVKRRFEIAAPSGVDASFTGTLTVE